MMPSFAWTRKSKRSSSKRKRFTFRLLHGAEPLEERALLAAVIGYDPVTAEAVTLDTVVVSGGANDYPEDRAAVDGQKPLFPVDLSEFVGDSDASPEAIPEQELDGSENNSQPEGSTSSFPGNSVEQVLVADSVSYSKNDPRFGIHGKDDRIRVTSTTSYPWRALGHLEFRLSSGWKTCSGAMVSPYHFLTAGHCVHNRNDGGWASQMRIYLGQNNDYRPYGEVDWTYVRSYTGWTRDQDFDHDWALVTLDRNIGNYTGWYGYEWRSGNSAYNGMNLNSAGYPRYAHGRDTKADELYRVFGPTDYATTNRIYYDGTLDTTGGQSGSPLWRYVSSIGERYINGVVSTAGYPYNASARINQDKFDRLRSWISADNNTRRPTDRADLVDHDQWFNTSHASISDTRLRAWDDLSISTRIRNNGTSSSGNFDVRFYARNIFTNRVYTIGTRSSGSIGALSSSTVTWSGTLPSSIPSGSYEVYWSIDSGNKVREFNESNNYHSYRLNLYVETSPADIGNTLLAAKPIGIDINGGSDSLDARIGDTYLLGKDVDLYRFEAARGASLTAQTSLPYGGNSMDTVLRLFDSDGMPLALDDNSGSGSYSRLTYTFNATGTYYLGVSGDSNRYYDPFVSGSGRNGSRGDYDIAVAVSAPSDSGDTALSATHTNIGPGSGSYTASQLIGNGSNGNNDVDLFRFEADAGGTLIASTRLPSGATPIDTYLRLFDSSGQELMADDDGGSEGYSNLNYTFLTGGIYYLGVSSSENRNYNVFRSLTARAGAKGDYAVALDLKAPSAVRGVQWHDLDGDGERDASEPGLGGWEVLLDGAGLPDGPRSATTASDGSYDIGNLPPGVYQVTVPVPANWQATAPAGSSHTVEVGRAEVATDISFGAFQLPVADANGPYVVEEAGEVVLSSVGSTDPDGSIVDYEWDFSYDGVTFDVDASGAAPTFSAATIDGPATRTVALRVRDTQGGTTIDATAVTIENAPPSAAIQGPISALVNQNVTIDVSAWDVFEADRANGFEYQIDWGDQFASTIAPTAENGLGESISHVYETAGSYSVRVRAIDKDGGVGSWATIDPPLRVEAVTAANLQQVVNDLDATGGDQLWFEAADDAEADELLSAINNLAAQSQPVTLEIDLGAESYSGLEASPPEGVTLVLNGNGETTVIVGASPALTISGGNVLVSGMQIHNAVDASSATDAPTILVTGGQLTLRSSTVTESIAYDQAAIEIRGGTVDLGTSDQAGKNRLLVSAAGDAIRSYGTSNISAVGNEFHVDSTSLSSPFAIEDLIVHALDRSGLGLVTYLPGAVYVTPSSGSIQRAVDAVEEGSRIHVSGSDYGDYQVAGKRLSIDFLDGPTLVHAFDSLQPDGTSLRVLGTAMDNQIRFRSRSGRGPIAVFVDDLPTGTFEPTERLIAWGEGGDDHIAAEASINLPVWFDGGDGDDRLQGAAAGDLLLGGDGDDQLLGGRDRDVLVGGTGADHLLGQAGDDLLIAGAFKSAWRDDAFAAVMAEWQSSRDYQTRIANLRGDTSDPNYGDGVNGSHVLTVDDSESAFTDDGSKDRITGAAGLDWYFANLSRGTAADQLSGLNRQELTSDLSGAEN
ncbi:pre-peptidase C-terminal domain-containing protein [Roseimaritima sediminicola]|uniref:pre-peptidase C-terminal domain-containing protein n=1 Tax=Roseimaritima sediminicola TaxID=2662066 RepID=UPI0013871A63|nr:pre-peptidase C-terminal domain-containing protein [Roseimaritima sediminicola]